jgi:hypothetical protein
MRPGTEGAGVWCDEWHQNDRLQMGRHYLTSIPASVRRRLIRCFCRRFLATCFPLRWRKIGARHLTLRLILLLRRCPVLVIFDF